MTIRAMPDLISTDNAYLILFFLVPGIVVLYVRAQFLTGWHPLQPTEILSYFTISVIYYALALPFVDGVLPIINLEPKSLLAWFTLVFLGPAVFGLFLGIAVQKNWFFRALQLLGLNPVHPVPTAWDWKFGRMESQWVLVTLQDGTRFAGYFDSKSFASSDPSERDIFIRRICDIDSENIWHLRNEKSVLISSDQVQTIEFWSNNPQENSSEQE